MPRKNVGQLLKMKQDGRKITMLTAYDYLTAMILDGLDIDILLVGDSLANVIMGLETTLPVTMEEMLHHTKAVTRGAKAAMVIGDMPFLSFQVNADRALENAGRFLKEADAQGVKIEGGAEMAATVARIVAAGIPVMGHLGLTPQSVHQIGLTVQGQEEASARKLEEDAKVLEEAGVFAVVLECIPKALAKTVTRSLSVPTIGIGAGPDCDGQVLVTHDLLGLYTERVPKFVKQYASLRREIEAAAGAFRDEVRDGIFPDEEHSYGPDS